MASGTIHKSKESIDELLNIAFTTTYSSGILTDDYRQYDEYIIEYLYGRAVIATESIPLLLLPNIAYVRTVVGKETWNTGDTTPPTPVSQEYAVQFRFILSGNTLNYGFIAGTTVNTLTARIYGIKK